MSAPNGDHPPGGSKVGMAWGIGILVVVIVMSGVIGMLIDYMAAFFQVIKMNLGIVLAVAVVILIFKAGRAGGPPPPPAH